jgi:uncharacterized membrane protein
MAQSQPMARVRHGAIIKAPREEVFAYVNDHLNVPDFMYGVGRFEPTTEQVEGLGATFETAVKIGPKELKSQVECVAWEKDALIRMEATSGFRSNTEWVFGEGDEPGTTRLDAILEYTLPGGLTGKVLGGLMGPFVEQGIKHVEDRIRHGVEG